MLKIKGMRNEYMTGSLTIVAGKAPVVMAPGDVLDCNPETEQWVVDNAGEMVDIATQRDIDTMSPENIVLTQEDIDAARAIEALTPQRKFNPRSPRNVAINRAVEQYGSVDNVPAPLKAALSMGDDGQPLDTKKIQAAMEAEPPPAAPLLTRPGDEDMRAAEAIANVEGFIEEK